MLLTKKQTGRAIADHTGQTVEQIEADSDRDRWFTAEDAKDTASSTTSCSAGEVAGGAGRHEQPPNQYGACDEHPP